MQVLDLISLLQYKIAVGFVKLLHCGGTTRTSIGKHWQSFEGRDVP